MSQRGDTMVEVLASIAIIAVALAGGYALSTYSLRTGLDASQRHAALSLAEGQIEFLKNANAVKSTDPGLLASYTANDQSFCISDATGLRVSGSSCSVNSYNVSITYNNATKVFTIKPSWASANNTNLTNELSLYYKLPDTFYPN